MRLKRLAAIVLSALTALPLTGCWDRRELEEVAFVMAIGVDKGKQSQYSVTAAIALPAKMAGGKGGGEGKPMMLTTVEAPTVSGAMAMIGTYMDRRVSLDHTKTLFMGEELAQISGLHTMDEFVRFRQARRSVFYIVTKGKAADFLNGMKPEMEKDPQKFIEQMSYNYRITGMLPARSQIQSFVTTVNTGYSAPLTYYAALKEEGEEKSGNGSSQASSGFKSGEMPRKGGPNIEMVGGAAFRGEKMAGVLTGDEMRLVLMLQDRFRRGYFSIPDPKQPDLFISLELRRGRPLQTKVDLSGQHPRITGTISLEGEIVAIQSNLDYTEPDMQTQLEAFAAGNLRDHMRELIKKTQAWDSDVAGFGEHVVKRFPTVEAWDVYDWPAKYPDAEITMDVRVTLRRFGVQLSPPRAAR
jgi:spore germination protein KC